MISSTSELGLLACSESGFCLLGFPNLTFMIWVDSSILSRPIAFLYLQVITNINRSLKVLVPFWMAQQFSSESFFRLKTTLAESFLYICPSMGFTRYSFGAVVLILYEMIQSVKFQISIDAWSSCSGQQSNSMKSGILQSCFLAYIWSSMKCSKWLIGLLIILCEIITRKLFVKNLPNRLRNQQLSGKQQKSKVRVFINTLLTKMQNEYLSWAEKNKISNQKDVYLVLRSIVFLKMCQGVDRINEQAFKEQVAKLKKKYQLFTSMIPNFDLKKFCEEFNVPQQEIQGAIPQLQRNSDELGQKLSSHQLWMSITALFIQMNDFCSLNVGETRLLLQKILNTMNAIRLEFRNIELNEKVKKLQRSVEEFVGSRNVDQQLAEVQMKELKLQVEALFDFLFKLNGKPSSQKKNY